MNSDPELQIIPTGIYPLKFVGAFTLHGWRHAGIGRLYVAAHLCWLGYVISVSKPLTLWSGCPPLNQPFPYLIFMMLGRNNKNWCIRESWDICLAQTDLFISFFRRSLQKALHSWPILPHLAWTIGKRHSRFEGYFSKAILKAWYSISERKLFD